LRYRSAARRASHRARTAGGGRTRPRPTIFTVNIVPQEGEPVTNHHIGPERHDGFDVGRDPRAMSTAELEQLGHARVSPLRARRLKCLDCCNDSAQEVRLCTAIDCPSWPFRMGKNPWRAPLGAEAHAQRAATMNRNRASAVTAPEKTQAQIEASASDGVRVPNHTAVDFSLTEMNDAKGGAS